MILGRQPALWGSWKQAKTVVSFGYQLSKTLILVPPRTALRAVLTAAMDVYVRSNRGRVQVDFSTGTHQLGATGVLITVLS